jgi:hypothetical protein
MRPRLPTLITIQHQAQIKQLYGLGTARKLALQGHHVPSSAWLMGVALGHGTILTNAESMCDTHVFRITCAIGQSLS